MAVDRERDGWGEREMDGWRDRGGWGSREGERDER
jgi:hypothetical protein